MRRTIVFLVAALLACVTVAATFTDVNSSTYWGKTGIPALTSALDGNFAAIEAGTETATLVTDKVYVGNDASNRTAMGVQGDVTISQDGTNVTTAIAAGAIVNADIATNAAIAASKLADADLGDVSIAAGVVSLDADVVAAAEMADADHGDVSWSIGVASVDDNAVLASEIGAGALAADVTVSETNLTADSVGASELADDAVVKANLAAGDFGDFTAGADGTCTIDAGAITAAKIDPSVVTNVLASGMTLPAVDGNAVTNLTAANIAAGGTFGAIDGGSLTNLNGAAIQADTIDDDSIDFGDVTGADLTLTDCGAIGGTGLTISGDVTATNATALFNTVGVDNGAGVNGSFSIYSTTQLVFIAGSVTNIIDSDITN